MCRSAFLQQTLLINWPGLIVLIPTIVIALKTKSLTVTVVSGVISVSGFRLYIKRASTAHAVDAFFEMLGFGEHFNSDVDHFVQSHKRQADFGASFSFIDLFNNAFHSFKRP